MEEPCFMGEMEGISNTAIIPMIAIVTSISIRLKAARHFWGSAFIVLYPLFNLAHLQRGSNAKDCYLSAPSFDVAVPPLDEEGPGEPGP
jgi:hypothetical protein